MKKEERNISTIKKVEEKIKTTEQEIKKEVIFNVPNSVTLMRIIFTFVFIYMLFTNYSRVALTFVFAIAAITDCLDGFLARRLKQTTKFGARLDQVTDRIFTVLIVGSLIIYTLSKNPSDSIILLLFLSTSREIVGLPGVIIALARKKSSYYVKYIGKITTAIQSIALGAIILGAPWAVYLAIATCIIGIISGFSYLKYSLS